MDRRSLISAISAGALAGITGACASTPSGDGGGGRAATRLRVAPALLQRTPEGGARFVPGVDFMARPETVGYVSEEWFVSGVDDQGESYLTIVHVRRPSDPARFSGVVLVEPLHFSGHGSVYSTAGNYILRSGHAWALVASQAMTLDLHVKRASPERYEALHMATGAAPQEAGNVLAASAALNKACNAILAQTAVAIRERQGPFSDLAVRHILLQGHSQTGMVTTNFVQEAHETHRRANGRPVFDGYFPSGAPITRFGPRDVPLVQVVSDGDVFDGQAGFFTTARDRAYRRDDSDAPGDRYRLYELAGMPHASTQDPPLNSTDLWRQQRLYLPPDAVMSTLPHNQMFNWGLHQLVQWVSADATPPRAARIQVAADGRYFAKDEHGNSIGGVRCVQMDVPRATYLPDLPQQSGEMQFTSVGLEIAFDAAKMRRLYGDKATYVSRFNARLDQLISQGWFLAEDAERMRAEALAQNF